MAPPARWPARLQEHSHHHAVHCARVCDRRGAGLTDENIHPAAASRASPIWSPAWRPTLLLATPTRSGWSGPQQPSRASKGRRGL